MTKERPLTAGQIDFLKSAIEFDGWAERGPSSGWTWGSASNTKRICDGLAARGYFEKHTTTIWNVDRYAERYVLTEKAHAAVASVSAKTKTPAGPSL